MLYTKKTVAQACTTVFFMLYTEGSSFNHLNGKKEANQR
jgi:hypothetical protein